MIGPLLACLVVSACSVAVLGTAMIFYGHVTVLSRLLGLAILGFAGTLAVFLGFALLTIFGS